MTKMINLNAWLTFNQRSITRMTKGRPSLSAGEKSMMISLNVPASIFTEPPLIAVVNFIDDLDPVEHRMEIVARVRDALDEIEEVVVTVPLFDVVLD